MTRRQALAHGWTPDAVAAQIDGGRWTGAGACCAGDVHRPADCPRRGCRAALLFVSRGPRPSATGSAAALLGLRQTADAGPVHLTVPYGSSARGGCHDVLLHRSARVRPHHGGRRPRPTSRKVHTILDLAVDAPDARQAMRTLTALAAAAPGPGVTSSSGRSSCDVPAGTSGRSATPSTLLREGVGSVLEADWALDVERSARAPRAAPARHSVVVEGRRLAPTTCSTRCRAASSWCASTVGAITPTRRRHAATERATTLPSSPTAHG